MAHILEQNWRKRASYVSEIHTSHTKHTVFEPFILCSNHASFKLQWTRI